MRVAEAERWQANPQESPLWENIPNADVDEHGVIRCKGYWNTAKKKVYRECDKFCQECNCITEHNGSDCIVCGTKFSFQAVKGFVH
jgi:hypothetical protein